MFLRIFVIFLIFLLLIFLPPDVFAVSVTITNLPSTVTTDPFSLAVSISGASPGINYLRVDLFKNETTNYFGETFSGIDWYGGSDGTKYFPVDIGSDKTWQGSIQARIGNTVPKDYDGTGQYSIRVRRYTAGGNYSNDEAKASAMPIVLAVATFTPTPTEIPTPTHTPIPTKSPSPTHMPTPTKIPTFPNTPKPSKSPTVSVSSLSSESISGSDILTGTVSQTITPSGSSISATPSSQESVLAMDISTKPHETVTAKTLVKGVNTSPDVPWLLIFTCAGGVCLVVCGILVYRKVRITNQES